jgi:drug/metabolite transporter (DMT)-like permease
MIPMAEQQSIFYMGPLWVGILGYFCLNEPYTYKEMKAAFFSMCGLLLIVKPAFLFGSDMNQDIHENSTMGKLLVFFGSWCFASFCIIMRMIRRKVTVMHNVLAFNVANVILAFLLGFFY